MHTSKIPKKLLDGIQQNPSWFTGVYAHVPPLHLSLYFVVHSCDANIRRLVVELLWKPVVVDRRELVSFT